VERENASEFEKEMKNEKDFSSIFGSGCCPSFLGDRGGGHNHVGK
jgi:hypothetical protein